MIADLLDFEEFDDTLDLRARIDLLARGTPEPERAAENPRLQMRVHSDKEIVDDRAVTKQRQVLERAPDAETRKMVRPVSQQVVAVEADVAGGRIIDPADHVEDRRLAGAVGADEADDLVLPDVDRHSGESLDAAKTLRDVAQRQQGRGRFHASHLLRRR